MTQKRTLLDQVDARLLDQFHDFWLAILTYEKFRNLGRSG